MLKQIPGRYQYQSLVSRDDHKPDSGGDHRCSQEIYGGRKKSRRQRQRLIPEEIPSETKLCRKPPERKAGRNGGDGNTYYTNDSSFNPNYSTDFSGDWTPMEKTPW